MPPLNKKKKRKEKGEMCQSAQCKIFANEDNSSQLASNKYQQIFREIKFWSRETREFDVADKYAPFTSSNNRLLILHDLTTGIVHICYTLAMSYEKTSLFKISHAQTGKLYSSTTYANSSSGYVVWNSLLKFAVVGRNA